MGVSLEQMCCPKTPIYSPTHQQICRSKPFTHSRISIHRLVFYVQSTKYSLIMRLTNTFHSHMTPTYAFIYLSIHSTTHLHIHPPTYSFTHLPTLSPNHIHIQTSQNQGWKPVFFKTRDGNLFF